jgi:tripartite-type tricarboxylate transporter receptor subunit TctC
MSPWTRLAGALLLAFGSVAAQAQAAYPNKPIKVIVPFPPGGGTDVVTRLLVDKIRESTGWTFVVDNKAGAGGNIGLDSVAKSKPDGFTIGMGQTANLAINPTLYAKMPYDATKDLMPVALVAGQPVVLVVNGPSRFKTLAELVAAAKEKPGSVSMASAGSGTVGHRPARGEVDFYFATPQTVVSFVKAGKLRALAVSSTKRLPVLPNVPTVSESGRKGFDTSDWKLLVAPAGTPVDIMKRLNAEVEKAMSKPATLAQLLAEGSVPMTGSPQDVAAYLKSEQQRWSAVVRESAAKVD